MASLARRAHLLVPAEIQVIVARVVDVLAVADDGGVAGDALMELEEGVGDSEVLGRLLLDVELLVSGQLVETEPGVFDRAAVALDAQRARPPLPARRRGA